MTRLWLTLLGGFTARLDRDRSAGVSIKKAQALVAYLAIPLGQPHPRDKLASLLWGDVRESQARGGLRHAIFSLRRLLGDTGALLLDGETIALDPAVVEVDVRDFEQGVAAGTPAELEKAVGLYQGDLLEGLAIEEPAFEEWLVTERLRLRELAQDALARLLAEQRQAGSLEIAVQTGLRLLAMDPLQEPVHRTLMRLYTDLGRRGAALRQYQLCVSVLQRELRAEPEDETKTLYRELLQRAEERPTAAARGREPAPPPPEPAPATALLPAESPLVGREIELAQLRDAREAAWAGRGGLVAVIGEAGIGKSRLAADLLVEAGQNGGRTLLGRCYESEHVLPFGPWIDAMRSGRLGGEAELLASLPGVWRAELARLVPAMAEESSGSPTGGPTQLFEAVAQLLRRAAHLQPVLLVLEDLHWADEMSLRLLAYVGRRLRQSRILLVVTVREEHLQDSMTLRHTLEELDQDATLARSTLGPLGREETMAMARTLLPPGDADGLDERLWKASEGNPFMIVETLRAFGGDRAPEGGRTLPLPERIRRVIADRVERLTDRGRRLVAVAAIIGRPFDFPLLQRAADFGEAEAAEGVEELVRHRILQGGAEGFEFTHDWIREVVHGDLLGPRRALVHRRVGEALEALHAEDRDRHALALGTHYREGQVWEKAVVYLTQAGMQAALRYAQRDAVVCFEQALDALAHLPESRPVQEQRTDLRFKLAHSLYGAGDFPRAMARFREAEELGLALEDHHRLGEIYAGMAYLLGSEGDFAGAIQTGLRALTIATSLGDLALQVWTSIGLGRVHYARGDLRSAIERMRWVEQALRDAPLHERFGRGSLLPSAACRAWLALCLAGTGDFAEAVAWGGEGVRIADDAGGPHEQVWTRYCLSRVHLARGDAAPAIALLERAMPLCEDRIPLYWPRIVASLGRALTLSGRVEAALPLFERALADVEAIKLRFGHPIILVWAAAAHVEAGQLDEAHGRASLALDLARQDGARGDEAWALRALGDIAARRVPPGIAPALERSVRALALAEELGMAPLQARCLLGLAALHHQAGDAAAARAELSRAVGMLVPMQMRHWLGSAEALLAVIR